MNYILSQNNIIIMKMHIGFILLLAFAALANTMQAQEPDNPLQMKIDSLNEVVKKQDVSIKVKTKDLEGNATIKRLQDDCKKRRKSIGLLQAKISSVSLQIDSSQSLLAEMLRPCDSLRAANATLERYKEQVNPLVKRQLGQMATSIDKTWLAKNYAEIDIDELKEELKLYEEFKNQDKGVAEAYKKLTAFGEDLMLFKQGERLVNSPYNASLIDATIGSFVKLVKKEKHPGRLAETVLVHNQLRAYLDCLKCFQKDIIEEIDQMLDSYLKDGTDKKAWKQVRSFLESPDAIANVKKLSQIPWLEKQYRQYVKQLEVDPYANKNAAHDAVMELVP